VAQASLEIAEAVPLGYLRQVHQPKAWARSHDSQVKQS